MRGKALVKCAMAAVMICSAGAVQGFAAENEELILTVEAGSGEDEFLYKHAELTYGPDDFYVGNDKILLLDTCGRRIMVFSSEGDWQVNIELTDVTGIPQSFECLDDKIYVFDTDHMIYTYSYDGILQRIDSVGIDINNISSDGSSLILEEDSSCRYIAAFEENDISKTELELAGGDIETSLTTDIADTMVYTDRLIADTESEFYMTNQIYETNDIIGEIRITKVTDGEVVSSEVIDRDGWYYYPLNFYQVEENCFYYMRDMEDYVQIFKVDFTGEIQDTTLEARIDAAESELTNAEESNVQLSSYTTLSKTRIAAYNTAISYVNCTWPLSEKNKTVISGTALPAYISSTTSLPKTMVGVPYCWGGCVTISEFLSQIDAGYQAGNIDTTSSLSRVSNTTGVDCSGFMSKIYGLSYTTTAGFYNSNYRKTTIANICKADYLLNVNFP